LKSGLKVEQHENSAAGFMQSVQHFSSPIFHSQLSCHRIITPFSKNCFFENMLKSLMIHLLISKRFRTRFFIAFSVCSSPFFKSG